MSDKVAFKEVWETLREVDVSKYTEEKMGLTYLSWSRAWMLTVDNYANAQYTFHDFDGCPYRTLPDGTGEVVTSVTIEGHVRSMPLPIMDYKNNPVVNPNARQVNDNRMRCLVKNLAIFGLGITVFAVLDDHLPSAEKDEQPEGKKPATSKKTPAKKKPALEKKQAHDEEWAKTFLKGAIDVMRIHSTTEQLTGYWKGNAQDMAIMKSKFPALREELNGAFVARSNAIKGNDLEEWKEILAKYDIKDINTEES